MQNSCILLRSEAHSKLVLSSAEASKGARLELAVQHIRKSTNFSQLVARRPSSCQNVY